MKVKIGWLGGPGEYGAGIYNRMVQDVLSKHYEVQNIYTKFSGALSYIDFLSFNRKVNDYDIVIRGFHGVVSMIDDKSPKNIAILQFVPMRRRFKKFFVYSVDKIFYRNLKKVDVIVTVSKFLQEKLTKMGFENVQVIYNAFDLKMFNFSDNDLYEFKIKFNLPDKPIIYIGTCRKEKGVVEVYNSLKDLDVFLISSGKKDVNVPTLNLSLKYIDNLRLLNLSEIVITMSKIPEAWNRTAHEAMLCKTPVIGSGLGGMQELLEGGRQIICRDFARLREIVENLMDDSKLRKKLGEKGYKFASNSKFTVHEFEKQWIKIIEELI